MKFVLIKLNLTGDTLLFTPRLRWLQEMFSGCELDVMVRGGCEASLHGNSDITRPRKTAI